MKRNEHDFKRKLMEDIDKIVQSNKYGLSLREKLDAVREYAEDLEVRVDTEEYIAEGNANPNKQDEDEA